MTLLRWARWLERLEVIGLALGIVGGAIEIYYHARRSRAELEEHEHDFRLVHDFTKPVKHKDHAGCACCPSYACFECGATVFQREPEGEEEEDAADA